MTSTKKILVFSIALEGYSELFQSCIISQREYCSKYGFNYILIDEAPRKLRPAEAAWLKIFLLRNALNCNFDWVAFIDADCEIRSHAPSFLEDLENYGNSKSIFLAHGFSGRINSGVIFLKNTIEARDYLDKVINNGEKEMPNEDKALYENGHMIHYGKNNPNIQIIEAVKWNNNFALDEQSYIQHYSGGILREQFLSSRGIAKPLPSFFRKIRNKFKIKFQVSMMELDKLLSFYLKKIPEFNSRKNNNK